MRAFFDVAGLRRRRVRDDTGDVPLTTTSRTERIS
jgi:hypothetical protein